MTPRDVTSPIEGYARALCCMCGQTRRFKQIRGGLGCFLKEDMSRPDDPYRLKESDGLQIQLYWRMLRRLKCNQCHSITVHAVIRDFDPEADTAEGAANSCLRAAETYDPRVDFEQRWPDWRIEVSDLHGLDEVIIPGSKMVLIDTEAYNWDPAFIVAHALAHLDLHLGNMGDTLSDAQEYEADNLADLRLRREGSQ